MAAQRANKKSNEEEEKKEVDDSPLLNVDFKDLEDESKMIETGFVLDNTSAIAVQKFASLANQNRQRIDSEERKVEGDKEFDEDPGFASAMSDAQKVREQQLLAAAAVAQKQNEVGLVDKTSGDVMISEKNQVKYSELEQSTNSMNLDLQKSDLMLQSVIDM